MPTQPAVDYRIRHLQGKLRGLYEFQALLGYGAFASVYLVRNVRLDRFEALKVLSETHRQDEGFRFIQEAKLVASIDHPNIVKVYDYGEVDGIVWFSMQHIDGPTLRAELVARGRLDPPVAVQLAIPLLDALGHSHQQGTVHRDIKPSNVLLDRQGRPYLMDFGIAKSSTNILTTATGNVLGTPAYVSPEQARGQAVDGRTDLYALSVALYEMMAGRAPFKADTALQTIMMRLQEEPDPLSRHCPSVDGAIEAVVMRGLARRPDHRWPEAEAMRDALVAASGERSNARERILVTSAPIPTVVEWLTPSSTELFDPREASTVEIERPRPVAEGVERAVGRRWAGALGLVAVLALVAFAAWQAGRSDPPADPATLEVVAPLPGAVTDTGADGGAGEGRETTDLDSAEPVSDSEPALAGAPGDATPPAGPASSPSRSLPPPPPALESDSAEPAVDPRPEGARQPIASPPPPPPIRRPATAPKLLSAVEPTLPAAEGAACAGASVILSLQVGEDGRVSRTRVLKAASTECTSAARSAAAQYVFQPAYDAQGQPVAASTTVNIRFPEVHDE